MADFEQLEVLMKSVSNYKAYRGTKQGKDKGKGNDKVKKKKKKKNTGRERSRAREKRKPKGNKGRTKY